MVDGVHFKVHSTKLAAASAFFNDLLGVPQPADGSSEVPVQESSAALEILLPYAYPAAVPPFDLGHPQCFEAIRAVDKYAVSTL